jgi:hypothetical protein
VTGKSAGLGFGETGVDGSDVRQATGVSALLLPATSQRMNQPNN